MAAAGPTYTGTGANYNDGGTNAWSSPTNVQGDTTGTSASVAPSSNGATSQRLRCSGFGFSIPDTAFILGVTVEVEVSGSNNNRGYWSSVKLLDAGTEAGDEKSDGAVIFSKAFKTFGGAADKWGVALTPAKVNAAGFGVSLKVVRNASQSVTMYAYRCRVTVDYAPVVSNSDSPSGAPVLTAALTESWIVPSTTERIYWANFALPVAASGATTYDDTGEHSGVLTVQASNTDEAIHTESSTGAFSAAGSTTEYRTLDDTPDGGLVVTATQTDSRGCDDECTGELLIAGSVSEAIRGYYDTASGGPAASGSVVEARICIDAIGGGVTANSSVTEARDYDDVSSGEAIVTGSTLESLVWNDTSSGEFDITGSVVAAMSRRAAAGLIFLFGMPRYGEQHLFDDSVGGTLAVAGVASDSYEVSQRTTVEWVYWIQFAIPTSSGTTYTDTTAGGPTVVGATTESRNTADNSQGSATVVGSTSDTRSAADTASGALTTDASATGAHTYTDSSTSPLTLSSACYETYQPPSGYYDSTEGPINIAGSSSDNHIGIDTTTGAIAVAGTVEAESHSAPITYTDTTPGASLDVLGSFTEAHAFSDVVLGELTLVGSSTDGCSTTDSQTGGLVAAGSTLNSRVYAEQLTSSIGVTGTRQELFQPPSVEGDLPTGAPLLAASVLESRSMGDSPSGGPNASGSGQESTSIADSCSSPIVVTGSRNELFQPPVIHNDSVTGELSAAGSISESWSYEGITYDSPTGPISVGGSKTESAALSVSPSAGPSVNGTKSESCSRTVTIGGSIMPTGTLSESSSVQVAVGTPFVVTGSASNTHSFSEVRTGALGIVASSSDTKSYNDTDRGELTGIGSVAISASYLDTMTGGFVCRGSAVDMRWIGAKEHVFVQFGVDAAAIGFTSNPGKLATAEAELEERLLP